MKAMKAISAAVGVASLINASPMMTIWSEPAWATCPSPLTGKDASGTTQNFGVGIDVAGNCYSMSGDTVITPSSNFTRLANATAYAAGQLVANATATGSVTPLTWAAARIAGGNFYIRRMKMTLSSKSVTNTQFTVHFYTAAPTLANGDAGTWSTTLANWACSMTVTILNAGTDVSAGIGAPDIGNECNIVAGNSTTTLWGLVVADAAYTPGSGETITVIPEIHQN